LADGLCTELNRDGSALSAEASLARLHSTYLDCSVLMPREELEGNLLNAYDPAVDIALRRPADLLNQALMAAWFGPVEHSQVLSACCASW
jgi:hypothetical protein